MLIQLKHCKCKIFSRVFLNSAPPVYTQCTVNSLKMDINFCVVLAEFYIFTYLTYLSVYN